MLIQKLRERKTVLQESIRTCKQKLSILPSGILRISETKGKVCYYHRKSFQDKNGKYISKKNTRLIKQLAEREYYFKTLLALEEELRAVDALLNIKINHPASTVYKSMNPSIKSMITPLEEPVSDAIKRWQSIPNPPMEPWEGSYVLKTKRGEYVRSKAEYNIANTLLAEKIPYKYEAPFMTVDGFNQRPDFTIMNPTTGQIFIWEHFGMIDRPDYTKRMINKLGAYELSGLFPGNGLIVTFDDGSQPLTVDHIRQIIDKLLR